MLRSFWMHEALTRDEATSPPLDGDTRADVCIVGGGFTGLWTALHLKQADPGIDVAVVEARHCGAGGSGANAGYMVPYWVHFPLFERLAGSEEALRLCRSSADAAGEIAAFAAQHGIDIQHQNNGVIWGSTCDAQTGHWREALKHLQRYQEHPFEQLTTREIGIRSGVRGYVAGVFEKDAGTIHPGHLVRGLRAAAINSGVRLFEQTPMTKLGRTSPAHVMTPTGSVVAERVVLAMYAWSLGIEELKNSVVAIRSDGMISAPQIENIRQLGWENGPAVMSSHHFTEACRTTIDGRVLFNKPGAGQVFGARVDKSLESTSRTTAFMRQALAGYYPTLSEVPVAAHWTGSIDRTQLGLPLFGRLHTHPNIFYGFGYSGRGIIPTYLGGRILSALVRDERDEWSQCPLVRPIEGGFPPEPVKYVGGALVRRAIEKADALDHQARGHDLLTRQLLKFKPGHWSRRRLQETGTGRRNST